MASIKGVSLKNIKFYRGHEGESCLQANLYLDNKKIGTVNEDTWSAEYHIQFNKKELETKFQEVVNNYFKENPQKIQDRNTFLYNLRLLSVKERELIKYTKKIEGFTPVYVVYFDKNQKSIYEYCYVKEEIEKEILKDKPGSYKIYTLKDFVIQ